jgi:hypothetical protein
MLNQSSPLQKNINLGFVLHGVCFFIIVCFIRVLNVLIFPLAVSTYLVILFLMKTFSAFASLHPNVGYRLREENFLLPCSSQLNPKTVLMKESRQ